MMSSQEIPSGYKKTKVGVIPEDWEVVKLGEIAQFYKGKGISKADISTDGINCIRYGELYTKYNEKIENIISKTSISKEQLFLSKANDILIPASGETAIDLATASCILKNDIGLGGDINIIRSKLNGIFLSYYLNIVAKTKIASLAQGISVIHLYSSQLKSLYISKPPLKEQQKIANILTTWDDAISKQDELIKSKEELKKSLIKKLFSAEIRFKDDDENEFPEWVERKLDEVSERVSVGLATSVTEHYIDDKVNGIPIIRNTNIKKGFFDDSDMLYLNKDFSNQHLNKRVNAGDVITVHTGSNVGLTCIVPNEYDNAQTFTTLIVTPKKELLLSSYLNQLLFSDYGMYQALRLVVGGGKGNLNTGDFKIYPISLPCLKEQKKIAEVLSNADKEIDLLKNELQELKEQKKGLMQKLLTGEVRVKI